jgi:hypothetical protein
MCCEGDGKRRKAEERCERHTREREREREKRAMGKCNKHPPGIRTALKVHGRGSPNEEAARLLLATRRFSGRAWNL